MAFVFQADRKISQTNKLANPVGPGQYFNIDSVSHLHTSAPFHTSSLRKTIFQVKQKQKPGPGEYQISKPIVQPNIKSVSNSHSIILKINSTGTAQFKSTNTRFKGDQTPVPGPGQYEHKLSNHKIDRNSFISIKGQNQAVKKMRQLSKTFYQKNEPAIPNKYRGLTDSKKEEQVPDIERLGPAAYQPRKTYHVNSTGSVWGKDKTKRFVMDRKIALGPGQYKADYNPLRPDQKANLSAGHFRSTSVRTYFDSLIYRTNNEQTLKERANKQFKIKDPAPGQYEDYVSSFATGQKPFSFQFFGSTVQRFPEQQIPFNAKPKKNAFYNLKSTLGKINSFNRGNHGFNSLTERHDEFLQNKPHEKIPGPGHYKEKVITQKKLKGVKVQKFGSTTDRPFYVQEPQDQVGPGKYDKNQNVQQFLKTRFGQIKNSSSTFKSTTNRNCFGVEPKEDHKFGEYDISYGDVANKLQRQKMFLQNLKKIQVQKPGFQSSNTRFPHYQHKQQSPIKEKQQRILSNREQQFKIKAENQRARSVMIEANKQQIFQKKIYGQFDKQQRFSNEKRGVPGVGAYATQTKWQKKTYNVKYQNK